MFNCSKTKILLFLIPVLLASCWWRSDERYTHASAREAAQRFYTMLVCGDYGKFVNIQETADSMTDEYHVQMVELMEQFMDRFTAERGKVLKVTATRDSLIEADSTALVWLDLLFADSLVEQICVPLVFTNEKWRMK